MKRLLALLGIVATGAACRRRWDLVARVLGWPPAPYQVGVERSLAVVMPDGVCLRTDHYYPKAPGAFPTILVRSPYGRGSGSAWLIGLPFRMLGELLAAGGYHVVIQTTRGRFNSGGTFDPGADEAADGRTTMAWIAEQSWFNGALGLWGPSYMGFTQWGVAANAPPYLKAIMPIVTASQLGSIIQPDGALALDLALRWIYFLEMIDRPRQAGGLLTLRDIHAVHQGRALDPAFRHLPIAEADTVAFGKVVAYAREWLARTGIDPAHARRLDHSAGVPDVTAAVHLVGGWYDFFLREQLADYAALRAAGRVPYLTIGPWVHTDPFLGLASLKEGLRWFAAHLHGDHRHLRRTPIRIYVMGAKEWRDLPAWPPPATPTRLFLHAGFELDPAPPPGPAPPSCYRYDPADPTPAVGGTLLFYPAGPVDQRSLEARPDVLVFTGAPLESDLEVIGPVSVELYVRSSLEHTDFFARLCRVAANGRAINICDGLFRVAPGKGDPQPDGSLRIVVHLWPTAYRFRRAERIRLLVASGAHPRWSRNLGTGEPLGSGTCLRAADQQIYHDADHPSALVLPVSSPVDSPRRHGDTEN